MDRQNKVRNFVEKKRTNNEAEEKDEDEVMGFQRKHGDLIA